MKNIKDKAELWVRHPILPVTNLTLVRCKCSKIVVYFKEFADITINHDFLLPSRFKHIEPCILFVDLFKPKFKAQSSRDQPVL